jgi:fructose-bisphosphate aldolase class 1
MARQQELMLKRMQDDDGFIAALDQSGGSSKNYGVRVSSMYASIFQSQTNLTQSNDLFSFFALVF